MSQPSELKARVWTAVVAAPLLIAIVIWAPQWLFAAALAALVTIAAWEWAGLIGLKSSSARAAYSVVTMALLLPLYTHGLQSGAVVMLLDVAVLWWLFALIQVVFYQKRGVMLKPFVLRAVSGWLVLVPAWLALVWLQGRTAQGPYQVLLLLVLVWAADIAAYFSGRRWGRRKLATRVSPGKTLEGALGALVAGTVFALLGSKLLGSSLLAAAILGLLTVAMSILGDLLESMYKRDVGMKDSGRLFPGHGGALDRIDSLTAAAPIFAAGLMLMELGP